MSILAIDFDKVIHDKAHPVENRRMGRPFDDAQSAMQFLKGGNHTLIIFTVMATNDSGKKAVEDWMKYYNIPYDEVTAIKPNADVFIDDKALRHIDWKITLIELEKVYEITGNS